MVEKFNLLRTEDDYFRIDHSLPCFASTRIPKLT